MKKYITLFVAIILSVSVFAERTAHSSKPAAPAATAPDKKADAPAAVSDEKLAAGKKVFAINCAACHQADGSGLKGTFPPLAKSDFLMADKKRVITALIKGLHGKITVNGANYNAEMPALGLSDDDIANVLTYVRNSFGNSSDEVSAAEVKDLRK